MLPIRPGYSWIVIVLILKISIVVGEINQEARILWTTLIVSKYSISKTEFEDQMMTSWNYRFSFYFMYWENAGKSDIFT